MTYEQTLELCRSYVKDHELQVELDTPRYKVFRMAKPGTRMYCVQLSFTPEGITLAGDYRVTNDRAVSSDPGLDIAWFAGELGSDYLASKFLREKWVPEQFVKEVEESADALEAEAEEARGEGDVKQAEILTKQALQQRLAINMLRLDGSEADKDELMEQLQEGGWGDADFPGYTYEYMERASLTAIQEKFAVLYKAWAEKTPAATYWQQAYQGQRDLIVKSLGTYSQQLGWGLGGGQEECWTLLDLEVRRLAEWKRELPSIATNLSDAQRGLRGHDHEAIRTAERQLQHVLDRLKSYEIHPHLSHTN